MKKRVNWKAVAKENSIKIKNIATSIGIELSVDRDVPPTTALALLKANLIINNDTLKKIAKNLEEGRIE